MDLKDAVYMAVANDSPTPTELSAALSHMADGSDIEAALSEWINAERIFCYPDGRLGVGR